MVPLPLKGDAVPLDELRTNAVHRFKVLRCSLHAKNQFEEFTTCIKEYFDLGHAGTVHTKEMNTENYCMPKHAVLKDSSTMTKLRVVFDASGVTASW